MAKWSTGDSLQIVCNYYHNDCKRIFVCMHNNFTIIKV